MVIKFHNTEHLRQQLAELGLDRLPDDTRMICDYLVAFDYAPPPVLSTANECAFSHEDFEYLNELLN